MPISIADLREPDLVKYVCALTFSDGAVCDAAIMALRERYGSIQCQSPVFRFDHTGYYRREMGPDLRKTFICFEKLLSIDCFVEYKLLSLQLESRFMRDSKRIVNIDPGYLELAKLVVASTKNFDHRVYLGKGVYADVQLRFHGAQFIANPWTYPDYRQQNIIDFFAEIRRMYLNELRKEQG